MGITRISLKLLSLFIITLSLCSLYARKNQKFNTTFQFYIPSGLSKMSLKRPQDKKEINESYFGLGLGIQKKLFDDYFLHFIWGLKFPRKSKEKDPIKNRDLEDNFNIKSSYINREGELGLRYYFDPESWYASLAYAIVSSTNTTIAKGFLMGRDLKERNNTIYYGNGFKIGTGKLWWLNDFQFLALEGIYSYYSLRCDAMETALYRSHCKQTTGTRQELGIRLNYSFIMR